MKTATLTFHGSHNYGSMLQAYALQQVMISIFGDNEILNFRSLKQKRMMRVFSMRMRLGPILKDLSHLFYIKKLIKKHKLFEEFLDKYLKTSDGEIRDVTARDLADYDLVCCGSDQIWNPCPEDFSLNFLLPFDIKAKKISYAASMGTGKESWPDLIKEFPKWLRDFKHLSVRELGSKLAIQKLVDRNDISINCDPVFLLKKEEWMKLIDEKRIVSDKYIFLYTLYANPTIISCAKTISSKLKIPVVISNFTNVYDLVAPFEKRLECGPKEFLNLMYNAEMIVTSSFHGTAFATLLNIPFVTVNGMRDNRIANLLKITKLENRSVKNDEEILSISCHINFEEANNIIEKERQEGFKYLMNCL